MQRMILALTLCVAAGLAAPARAEPPEDIEAAPPVVTRSGTRDCPPGFGCVTRQPLPRYVSIKGGEARARRGPSAEHRVDWVYQRPGLPMRVTAEYENWRRVEDPEGAGGWMHYALLSPSRMAMITSDMAEIRATPDAEGALLARTEAGVVARLTECRRDWCRISHDGIRGWLPKSAFWGVDAAETFD